MERQFRSLIDDIGELETNWRSRLGLMHRDVIAERFNGTRVRGTMTRCAFAGIEIDGEYLVPETIKSLTTG